MDFSGDLTIIQVRPARRREVTLLITGLPFNTPDLQVKHYVEAFGAKVMDSEPKYGVHKEGPWRGQYNGERRYQAVFTRQIIPMGPFHLLNNSKIRVVYPGNTRTCGRCYQPPTSCPGGAIAKVCGEKGGERVSLFNHMKKLWDVINYNPGSERYDDEEDDEDDQRAQGNDIPILEDVNKESFGVNTLNNDSATNRSVNSEENTDGETTEEESESEIDKYIENNQNGFTLKEDQKVKTLIPGLPMPLSKNQKKKARKNKRKNALTPPDTKDSKVSRVSETPPDVPENPSLVTKLIRKYSSTDNKNDEESPEAEEPSCSPASTSTSSSPLLSSVAPPSGIVIPTGV